MKIKASKIKNNDTEPLPTRYALEEYRTHREPPKSKPERLAWGVYIGERAKGFRRASAWKRGSLARLLIPTGATHAHCPLRWHVYSRL
ncbi:hypothetical protein JYU34_021548, partial [Plutella xylostella]